MKKPTYRQSYRLLYVFFGAAFFLGFIAAVLEFEPLIYIGMAVVLAGVIQSVIFCRCPHCGRLLGMRRGGMPAYCPDCGEKLDEEK